VNQELCCSPRRITFLGLGVCGFVLGNSGRMLPS
jgi:hypothetical protein